MAAVTRNRHSLNDQIYTFYHDDQLYSTIILRFCCSGNYESLETVNTIIIFVKFSNHAFINIQLQKKMIYE
jgi:hypothetical protein